jgi:hypothetical protein
MTPSRLVAGIGDGWTRHEAARHALIDAASRRHHLGLADALDGLEAEFFGPAGHGATGANAASGQ